MPNRNSQERDAPVSRSIPYGRQQIDDGDVRAVEEVLRSDWLTTGPQVEAFEHKLARVAGSRFAVAVNSGTAALHSAFAAAEIGPGDEVLIPAITFAATANCVIHCQGTPVFVDIDPRTLLVDPRAAESLITSRTRALVAVDYAGQPCDYDDLRDLATRHGLTLIADACHSLGGKHRSQSVGSLAAMSAFSFHPVKPITTGEGGAITTDDEALATRLRKFRNHGLTSDLHQRASACSWEYDIEEPGYNYRLSDIQCALGRSQLGKLAGWVQRRREIARWYDSALVDVPEVSPLSVADDVEHAYHLYVVRLEGEDAARRRRAVFHSMRADGILVNVHYKPVHLHGFYRRQYGTREGLCPAAEDAYQRILSLPIYPAMSAEDVQRVIESLTQALRAASLASTLEC